MTAPKMVLFPEKALELEHSPQLKMKLLALERDAERASATFSALATSAENLGVAMSTCATRERALSACLDAPVSEASSSANCGDGRRGVGARTRAVRGMDQGHHGERARA